MTLLLLAACAKSVLPLFESHRAAALAAPAELPRNWKPHAAVAVGWQAVDEVVDAALVAQGELGGAVQLGPIKIEPELRVVSAKVRDGACDGCLRVDATLDGTLHGSGLGGKWTAPASGSLALEATLSSVPADAGFDLVVTPVRVLQAKVEAGGRQVALDTAPLGTWLANQALAQLSPIPLAHVGDRDAPLRAVRVDAVGEGLVVELATSAHTGALASLPRPPAKGWTAWLAPDAAVDLGRTAAFDQGPVSHDVVPVPESLDLDGDAFRLVLRLWRPVGKGWWRDVAVNGTLAISKGKVSLRATSAEEVAQSRGAVLVDPLAAIAEGAILDAVEVAITTSLPASTDTHLAGTQVKVELDAITGRPDAIEVQGSLVAKAHRATLRR